LGKLSLISAFLQSIVVDRKSRLFLIKRPGPRWGPREPSFSNYFGSIALTARIKRVYTRNMDSEEVDFVACRQCVCTAARHRSRDLTRTFEKAMRAAGVRGTQFTLLAMLVQTGPIATTRLADLQGLERTTLTRNLRLLVRDGFVRIDEGEDRRVRKVAITPAGEEAARRAFPFWKKAQDAALASGEAPGGAQG
jgi:DNA-binding MarR family transcriptional regulator